MGPKTTFSVLQSLQYYTLKHPVTNEQDITISLLEKWGYLETIEALYNVIVRPKH
jgi:hypothetical protein